MKKFIKVLSVLLVAVLCTVGMAVFAACGDKNELATDTIYITVLDESGNPINGTTFGKGDYNPDNHQVEIQFCTLAGGCTAQNAKVGADGKAEFNLALVKELAGADDVVVELHVLNVTAVGYAKDYNQYKVSEIPKNVTVNLKKA